MVKCFVTGVELRVSETFLLDVSTANRALKALRQHATLLERLLQQLGPTDEAEVYSAARHAVVTRKERRLVSQQVAMALSAAYPEKKLFITWAEWRLRRINLVKAISSASATSDCDASLTKSATQNMEVGNEAPS